MTAALLVLVQRYGLTIQRAMSVGATALQLAVAIGLYMLAGDGEPRVYLLGNWPAPFGIVLVLDRLAATMLLLTGVLAIGVVLASLGEWDQLGRHFHALFQFQLLGINGAFLTGDLFNLFVFFEVLLIASYGLMLHGGGPRRLKAGFHYIAINLIGSTVFLFAVGTIYAVTGTLNMADLAVKVPQVAAGNEALAVGRRAAAVHGVRHQVGDGAVALVAAADLRLDLAAGGGHVRDHDQGRRLFDHPRLHADLRRRCRPARRHCHAVDPAGRHRRRWCLARSACSPAARLRDLACYSVIASMGTVLIAIGLSSADGLAAALYYAVQSTLTSAALFLLAGLLVKDADGRRSRATAALRSPATAVRRAVFPAGHRDGRHAAAGRLHWQASDPGCGRAGPQIAIVWPAILITSLLLILGFARAGIDSSGRKTEGAALPDPEARLCRLIADCCRRRA